MSSVYTRIFSVRTKKGDLHMMDIGWAEMITEYQSAIPVLLERRDRLEEKRVRCNRWEDGDKLGLRIVELEKEVMDMHEWIMKMKRFVRREGQ